jgi:phage FluMu gp28-like protein
MNSTWPGKENRSKRTPMVLLLYQQAWNGDGSQVKIIEKSRRVGLSWGEAAEDAVLVADRERGMDVFYIGYNLDMAREFIEDCADWLKFYNQAAAEIEEFIFEDERAENRGINAFRIVIPGAHKVVALSSRPSNLRGKQGKIVIDEAAFHDDLRGLMKAALAMLMWGGRVVVISTHFGEDNYFNELIADSRAGKKPYSVHRVTLDDALEAGLYRRICLRLGETWSEAAEKKWRQSLIDFYGDDADEELFCIPSQGGGAYLSRALIEARMSERIPVIRWEKKAIFAEAPDYKRTIETALWCETVLKPYLSTAIAKKIAYVGEDFGRSGDLSVIAPFVEMENLTLRALFYLELRNIPFQQQEQILYFICDRLCALSGMALDSRGNGQYLGERAMQRYGADRVAQVMISEAWYRDTMPKYKARFTDGTILLPKDADVLNDNRAIRMVKGVAKIPDGREKAVSDKKQRHGDSAIAGAMAVFASHQFAGFSGIPQVHSAMPAAMVDTMAGFFGQINYRAY